MLLGIADFPWVLSTEIFPQWKNLNITTMRFKSTFTKSLKVGSKKKKYAIGYNNFCSFCGIESEAKPESILPIICKVQRLCRYQHPWAFDSVIAILKEQ